MRGFSSSQTWLRRALVTGVLGASLAFLTTLGGAAAAQPSGATTGPTSTSAEAQTARISGTVYDARPLDGPDASQVVVPSGLKPIAGATVSVPSQGLTTVTDSSGHYELSGVSASGSTATLTVTIRASGYGAYTSNSTPVQAAQTTILDGFMKSHPTTIDQPSQAQLRPYAGTAPTSQSTATPDANTGGSCSGQQSNTTPPKVIRVWFTGRNNGLGGAGPEGQVVKFDFEYYVEHVINDEWPAYSPPAAYQAGAIAAADYAWYYINKGSKGSLGSLVAPPPNCNFDVDDWSGDYQEFLPYEALISGTRSATYAAANWIFQQGGTIPALGYSSGYSGMPCSDGAGSQHMYQYGSVTCANDGYNFTQIINNYYPGGSFLRNTSYQAMAPTPSDGGYWLAEANGTVRNFGNAGYYGEVTGSLNAPIVAMAPTPDGGGYWLVGADGGIFTFGDAGYYGSTGGDHLNAPVVGMAPTPDGHGYWLVGGDGGIFTFGDAGFYGSTGGDHLNAQIIGMAATPDGGGYWLVGSDGGIFTFGDAGYYGSEGGATLNAPIVGMARTANGGGYWLVGADGGIFTFGDAGFYGSAGGTTLNQPIVGMAADYGSGGYWLVAGDGGIFSFNAPFYGSGV